VENLTPAIAKTLAGPMARRAGLLVAPSIEGALRDIEATGHLVDRDDVGGFDKAWA
jgi:hypothetical protein